jgi:hypothetical protein
MAVVYLPMSLLVLSPALFANGNFFSLMSFFLITIFPSLMNVTLINIHSLVPYWLVFCFACIFYTGSKGLKAP